MPFTPRPRWCLVLWMVKYMIHSLLNAKPAKAWNQKRMRLWHFKCICSRSGDSSSQTPGLLALFYFYLSPESVWNKSETKKLDFALSGTFCELRIVKAPLLKILPSLGIKSCLWVARRFHVPMRLSTHSSRTFIHSCCLSELVFSEFSYSDQIVSWNFDQFLFSFLSMLFV